MSPSVSIVSGAFGFGEQLQFGPSGAPSGAQVYLDDA
jgi:hypothetical protein